MPSSSAIGMFVNLSADYPAATSSSIKVIDVPANFVVGVVNATSGDTLASAEADSAGVAFFDAGKYYIPIDAGVMVFDGSGGNLLASSTIHASIYGGDVFHVGSPGSEAITVTVNSVDSSGDPLDGQLVETARGTSIVSSGFTPLSFEVMQDPAYYVLVQDDDAHIFDYWNDGS